MRNADLDDMKDQNHKEAVAAEWKEIRDMEAKKTQTTPRMESLLRDHHSHELFPRYRYLKTQQMVAAIMGIVTSEWENKDKGLLLISKALTDLFFESGVDVVTDEMRREAGLPPRDGFGLTAQEMRILELHRQQKMLEAFNPIIVVPEGKAS